MNYTRNRSEHPVLADGDGEGGDRESRRYKPPKEKQGPPPVFRYLLWFFIIWFGVSAYYQYFHAPDRVSLSYTEFKQEVRDGAVSDVTVKGQNVTGEFSEPYVRVAESGQDSTRFNHFSTTIVPFQDTELMSLLEQNDVRVNAEAQDDNWWIYLLVFALPWILLIGYSVYASKKMRGQMKGMFGSGGLFGVGKSKAKRFDKSTSTISFSDVAGLENAKSDLREIVEYLKDPGKFTALGAEIPKGLLLMGPPGTGKTLLSRAVAGEAGVPFFSISGSEFIEMFVGVGASRVRDMFNTAKKEAPAIIFIDEIDSVGRTRGAGVGGGHDEREQTLNQILSEMDGFEPHESVVVIAATNRPDVLDPALTRPGRFDRQVTLELPHKEARKKILDIHTREVPVSADVNLENLASRTVGLSGADLKNIVNEAALLAGRNDRDEVTPGEFDQARDKVLLGAKREEIIDDEERRLIAYHEAGHALLARVLPNTDPLQKVTIIPRGRSLGATEQAPEKDKHNYAYSYLRDRITVTLGGRVAEKIVFGEYTNGAEQDLKNVTSIARRMVCRWGMSERLGAVAYSFGEDHVFLGRELAKEKDFSEETARIIDEEIHNIIEDTEQRALDIMQKHRNQLDAIAQGLLAHETLFAEDIDAFFGDGDKKTKDSGENTAGKAEEQTGKAGEPAK